VTASAARARPTDTLRAGGAPLLPAALAASVDLLALEPASELVCQDFERESIVSSPGLDLRFDGRRIAWHATASCVAFIFGQPRLDGLAAHPDAIAQAIAEDARLWRRCGGRFAIARVDLVAGEVLLVTDRYAVWPLVWRRDGQCIAFSDRADRIPAGNESDLDPQALFDYVYFHVIPAPRTAFRGTRRVEPATAVTLSSIAVEQESTWAPRFASASAEAPSHAALRSTLREAVLAEAADDPIPGCFLSGGTDSSTVAGILAHEHANVRTFSIGFDADGYDEMSYARIAARHFGTEHHEYYVTPYDLTHAIACVAGHYDQPFGNSSALPAYYCARTAAHNGVRKLLAGDGGDELFGGNLRYAKQKLFEAYGRLPAPMCAILLEPLLLNAAARAVPGIAKASSFIAQARVPMPARMETYNLLARLGASNVFTPRFLDEVITSAPAALQSDVFNRSGRAAFVDRMLAYDWRFTLADNDLPKVTGTAQLAGVDVGFPLLGDAVVDLSLQLPADQKVHGLRLRHFFKEALAGFLPPEIIAKKKHGFGLPVGPWLITSPPLRALAYESLNSLAQRGLIRPALVNELFSRRLEEHPGYYGEMGWVVMMLEQWLRSHAPTWSCR